mmetsp:Transcript_79693/g.205007  ORF Transcript_79693/g.205007 Transcript_79693/m.205007 type:complete len:274 (+) Transcript_79693:509-1330(+)
MRLGRVVILRAAGCHRCLQVVTALPNPVGQVIGPTVRHQLLLHARNATPVPARVRGVVHNQLANTVGARTERAPGRLRLVPGHRRALVVAGVANDDVRDATGVRLVLVDGVRSLVAMHVAVEHDVDTGGIEQLLHVRLHLVALLVMVLVAVVHGRVEHDNDPGRDSAVHLAQVILEELVLRRALLRGRIAAHKADNVHGTGVVTVPVGRVGAGLAEGHRVALHPVHVLVAALSNLVVPRDPERRDGGHQRLRHDPEGLPGRRPAVRVRIVADQ